MLKRSRVLASAAVVAVMTGLGAPAWAETLQDAIALAYRTNPNLLAQRATQRALDESVVQARSGLRPTLSASAGVDYTRSDFPAVTQFVDTNGDGVPDTQISTSSSETQGANLASASARACGPAAALLAPSTRRRPACWPVARTCARSNSRSCCRSSRPM